MQKFSDCASVEILRLVCEKYLCVADSIFFGGFSNETEYTNLIFALARYGGLRIPSELFGLKWDDILWDSGRFIVHSPQAFELAEPNQQNVITIYNKKNRNLRTHAHRIIKRAGLAPWPKTFQNLRSTRETELVEDFPVHVVTAWLGNTPKVAEKHYLQVTEEHFKRASKTARNTAQYVSEKGRNGSKEDESKIQGNAVSTSFFNALQVLANFCVDKDLRLAPRVGFEPTT